MTIYDCSKRPKRLASQYIDSATFRDMIKAYQSETFGVNSVCSLWNDFSEFFDIDKASGRWLDIIGAIVGQTRQLVEIDTNPFFGFVGAPGATDFDSGTFRGIQQSLYGSRLINDPEYRLYIRGRIAKNQYKSTIEDTIEVFEKVFGVSVFVTDNDSDYTVFIDKILEQWEINLIENTDLLPKVKGFHRNILHRGSPEIPPPDTIFFAFEGVDYTNGFDVGQFAGFEDFN